MSAVAAAVVGMLDAAEWQGVLPAPATGGLMSDAGLLVAQLASIAVGAVVGTNAAFFDRLTRGDGRRFEFAAGGVRFERAYDCQPLCTPARSMCSITPGMSTSLPSLR